jgi:acyl-CoA thioester hydrolase
MHEPACHGRTDPRSYTCWAEDHVRFADLDLMGHVNNVATAVYFESGRVAILMKTGLYTPTEDRAAVLAHISMDYLREILFPCSLRIGTRIERIGRTSFEIGSAIFTGEHCAATGRAVIVRVDRQRRPTALADEEVARLRGFMLQEAPA